MKNLLCIILLCSFTVLLSQKTEIDSLKKLGRDSLIKLAIKKIKEPGFDPRNYDRIVVKANPASLVVNFELSIVFHSSRSCFYDKVFVALVGSGTGMSLQGDCANPKFYSPSSSDKRKIQFVFDAINKENEIGDIPGNQLDPGTSMEITERLEYYYVEMSSWSTYSHYKVHKITGKISEAGHKHYARESEPEEEKEEVIK